MKELKAGEGQRFRMYDDDGELYYDGRIVGDYDGFEPLDDFGMPNVGCTNIRYLNANTGAWETLRLPSINGAIPKAQITRLVALSRGMKPCGWLDVSSTPAIW